MLATISLAHSVLAPRAYARAPRGPRVPRRVHRAIRDCWPNSTTRRNSSRGSNAAADDVTANAVDAATDVSALLLVGFHPDEIQPLTELVGSIAAELELTQEIGVALVNRKSLDKTFAALLEGDDDDDDDEEEEETTEEEYGDDDEDTSEAADGMDDLEDLDASFDGYEVRPGDWAEESFFETNPAAAAALLPPAVRCVLLRGDGAKALMPHLRWEMQSAGFDPAVFGAFTASNADATIATVATNVVRAHERHWRLSGDPPPVAGTDDVSAESTPLSPYAEEASSQALWATTTAWTGEEGWRASDAVPVMNVLVDAATVPDPSPFGGSVSATDCFRSDASAVVALDGVVGEDLRSALLDAITEPGWDHATSASPPTPMWDRATDDGINGTEEDEDEDSPAGTFRPAPGSWGLTEEGLRQVASAPATQVFLSRIQALYPEYHVRTMPADALEPDGIPGGMGGGSRITTAVGNAAVYGDDFKWHIDMDPCALSPSSPFAERYGLYVNRSAGRPLFVSALVYLNGPGWTPDMNAETLVLDPGTGTGVFIRPAPGRVLLMDQDVTHRVSTPSAGAKVPRYSLVLKLCFYPKNPEERPRLPRAEWGRPATFGTARGLSSPFAERDGYPE